MTNYVTVLETKYVGEQWSITGNDYKTLEWYGASTKPTQSKLDSLWAEVQKEILNKKTTEATTRQAVLDKLGLTADEVAALLG